MMNIDRLRSIVNKTAIQTGVGHQNVYDMYFFERFLYRLSQSRYKNNFVFKGGFLLESLFGLKARTTIDIDLKADRVDMSDDRLLAVFNEICNVAGDDNIEYKAIDVECITTETKYEGKSVKIDARLKTLHKKFTVDVAYGDVVTPEPFMYEYKSKIDGSGFMILAYTKETIIAEKFETFISKGTGNSRSKDLFDICMLVNRGIDFNVLRDAVKNTFEHRQTPLEPTSVNRMIQTIKESAYSKELFEKYIAKHSFAVGVSFEDAIESIARISEIIFDDHSI